MAASFETLSVSTTATPISATLLDGHEDGALIVVETGSGRFRADGTAPTASVGVLVGAGSVIELYGGELADFQIIATGSLVTVRVHTFVRGNQR